MYPRHSLILRLKYLVGVLLCMASTKALTVSGATECDS